MTESHPVADQNAREQALDPARSFIVQAPAGSGKTELLTQRYLALLARSAHPEEILAITFTNKAAAEMRSRVLKAIEHGRAERLPDKVQRRTWELARAVCVRDAEAGWQLAENPRRLRVLTIDALCAALARQLPLAAGFGAPPATVDDAREHYRDAARETLALIEDDTPWTAAIERLLRHLDNNVGAIENLLAQMLARRDQWLRHVTGGPGEQRIERSALEAALQHAIEDALAGLAGLLPVADASELVALADYAAANLAREGSTAPLAACAGLTQLPGARAGDLCVWLGIAQLLLTNEGDWRRSINKSIGFPPGSAGKSPAEKEAFDAMKERLAALLARLSAQPGLGSRLHALRGLPTPVYEDGQWEILEALAVLLPLAAAQLRVVFRERGEVDFMAVAHGALEALGGAGEPSDLALALDYRLQHILVDEFQDTSLSQYQLLERLTAGWAPDDGRTLFVVGDPMQSIYRFREAEVGLYLRARHEGIGTVRLLPLSLTVNFRSQQGVVDWVNDAFARVLPASEDVAVGAVPYAPSVAYHKPLDGMAVSVHPQYLDDPTAEARTVVALVQAAQTADPQGKIALLVRARPHLAAIVPALRRAGIGFVAIDIEPLGHRQAVQDLLALTRALDHPADRLAWLAVLRAPWCGLSLADLHALVKDGEGRTIRELADDQARLAQLGADGRARLVRTMETLALCAAHRRRASLRHAVEGAWLALGGPASVLTHADLDDAEVYFSLLEKLEAAGGITDLALLEAETASLFALPEIAASGGAVEIMTLHKAKGLEFDTVIVPGLGRSPRRNDAPLLYWAERSRAHADADLLLAPIRASGADDDPVYAYLRGLEAERSRLEDGRLLYVAATRAKKRLHLLGHVTVREDKARQKHCQPIANSLLSMLWPAVHGHYQPVAMASDNAPDIAEPPSKKLPGIRRFKAGWQPPPLPPAIMAASSPPAADMTVEFDWAGETARHTGSVVHRFLQRIARDGMTTWDEARITAQQPLFARLLAQSGVPRDECQAAAARAAAALTNALADERGRWLLDARHGEARAEYALGGVLDGVPVQVVLDRTFVDEQGRRWIVDYKTSAHSGGGVEEFLDREQQRYRGQLERYAQLMARLDGRPIRLGLYFPLLGGWREWAYPGQGGDDRRPCHAPG